MTPKVSIIIPIYNVEEYIKECLESIINQTLKDIEIICINDGTKDNSMKIVEEYASKDSRFVIISQENQGQGVARNKGIEIARGECIAFVDPDDWIDTNAYEILYNNYKQSNVDVVLFDYECYRQDNGRKNVIGNIPKLYKKTTKLKLEDKMIFNRMVLKHMGLFGVDLAVWNKIYSSEFIKKNNIKFAPMRYLEDTVFTIKFITLAKNILYINQPFYHYRERIGSVMNRASNESLCVIDNIKMVKDFLIEQNLYEKYNKQFENYYALNLLKTAYSNMPEEIYDEYKVLCKQILSVEGYKKFLNKINGEYSLLENIFSVRNKKINGMRQKNIRVLGFDIIIKKK